MAKEVRPYKRLRNAGHKERLEAVQKLQQAAAHEKPASQAAGQVCAAAHIMAMSEMESLRLHSAPDVTAGLQYARDCSADHIKMHGLSKPVSLHPDHVNVQLL